MALIVTLAEYAGVNADGTFNIVRGGIDLWRSKGFPFQFAAFLMVEVAGGQLTVGQKAFKVSIRDAAGANVCEIAGEATIAKPEDRVRAALGVVGIITAAGPLTIDVTVEPLETVTYVVTVVEDLGAA